MPRVPNDIVNAYNDTFSILFISYWPDQEKLKPRSTGRWIAGSTG